eukprot:256380-Pleurochrysis_carterae.AAC.1
MLQRGFADGQRARRPRRRDAEPSALLVVDAGRDARAVLVRPLAPLADVRGVPRARRSSRASLHASVSRVTAPARLAWRVYLACG